MSNLTDKKREGAIRARIRRLVDGKNVALSAIALKSGVEQGTVKALYEQEGHSKRTIAEVTAKKLEKGLDAQEKALGMVKRCSKCGKELPYGMFYSNKANKDGMNSSCKSCDKETRERLKTRRSKGTGKVEEMNNNTENAITADIVRRVKAEDKRDVESKFMAPYFRLTPKQLDEVRKGLWDKLLLTPEVPKRADSVLASVEALRGEVAMLRREVEAVMVDMGIELKAVS